MKLYSEPEDLQKVINSSFIGSQFTNIFNFDVAPKLVIDKDNNLLIEQKGNSNIDISSTKAYLLSKYYKTMGDALSRIESYTGQEPEEKYDKDKELGILFYEPFLEFVGKEFKIYRGRENGSICKECNNSSCSYPNGNCNYINSKNNLH